LLEIREKPLTKEKLSITYERAVWEAMIIVGNGEPRLPYCPEFIDMNDPETVTIYPLGRGYSIGVR